MNTKLFAESYKPGRSQISAPVCDNFLSIVIFISGICAEVDGRHITLQILLASSYRRSRIF
jgi:hypothetical protein